MRPVLIVMEKLYKDHGNRPEGCTVTSGTDSTHSAGSLHYYGYALDFRIKDPVGNWTLTDFQVTTIAALAKKKLGSDYNVITHSSHIHIEYDKAKLLVELEV